MKIKHEGVSVHRLHREPLEALYAERWAKVADHTLGYLLYGQDRSQHFVTQRDAEIAATIIQWLGSPVGQNFVAETLEQFTKSTPRPS